MLKSTKSVIIAASLLGPILVSGCQSSESEYRYYQVERSFWTVVKGSNVLEKTKVCVKAKRENYDFADIEKWAKETSNVPDKTYLNLLIDDDYCDSSEIDKQIVVLE